MRVVLAGADGNAMQDLASNALLTSSGLTRMIDRLEKRFLLARRAAVSDQRGRQCIATKAGSELIDEVEPQR
jgi:MarR family transcriptional regulator, 2-MHQ and catechol-resistance regulon repressor